MQYSGERGDLHTDPYATDIPWRRLRAHAERNTRHGEETQSVEGDTGAQAGARVPWSGRRDENMEQRRGRSGPGGEDQNVPAGVDTLCASWGVPSGTVPVATYRSGQVRSKDNESRELFGAFDACVLCLEPECGLLQGRKPSLAQCPRHSCVRRLCCAGSACAHPAPAPLPEEQSSPGASFAQPGLPPRASGILRTSSPAGASRGLTQPPETQPKGIFTSKMTLSPARLKGGRRPSTRQPALCNVIIRYFQKSKRERKPLLDAHADSEHL